MHFAGTSSFIVILCVAGAARAGEGDALIEQGVKLRRAGKDVEALDVFRRANEAEPTAKARVQIALAEQALGRWEEADRDLRKALADDGDPWIASHRDALVGSLDAIDRHLAAVLVTTNASDAELWVDGASAGPVTIEPLRLAAGHHRVEVRAKGFDAQHRELDLVAGVSSTEEIRLAPQPTRPAFGDERDLRPDAPEGPTPHAPEKAAPLAPSMPSPTNDGVMRRALAWGAFGAAGAFLGIAVTAQFIRQQKTSLYNDDSRCLYGDLTRDQRCGTYRGQGELAQNIAYAGYVASGVLGITSAVLFFVAPPRAKRSDISLHVRAGAGMTDVSVAGQF